MAWKIGSIEPSVSPEGAGTIRTSFTGGGGTIMCEVVNTRPGYRFSKWTFTTLAQGDFPTESQDETTSFGNEQTDGAAYPLNAKAEFVRDATSPENPDDYVLVTVVAGNEHGTVSGGGFVRRGQRANFQGIPESDDYYTEWSFSPNGTNITYSADGNSGSMTVNSDTTCTANFLRYILVKIHNSKPYYPYGDSEYALINCKIRDSRKNITIGKGGVIKYKIGETARLVVVPDRGATEAQWSKFYFEETSPTSGILRSESSLGVDIPEFTIQHFNVEICAYCLYPRCNVTIEKWKEDTKNSPSREDSAGTITGDISSIHYPGDSVSIGKAPAFGFRNWVWGFGEKQMYYEIDYDSFDFSLGGHSISGGFGAVNLPVSTTPNLVDGSIITSSDVGITLRATSGGILEPTPGVSLAWPHIHDFFIGKFIRPSCTIKAWFQQEREDLEHYNIHVMFTDIGGHEDKGVHYTSSNPIPGFTGSGWDYHKRGIALEDSTQFTVSVKKGAKIVSIYVAGSNIFNEQQGTTVRSHQVTVPANPQDETVLVRVNLLGYQTGKLLYSPSSVGLILYGSDGAPICL